MPRPGWIFLAPRCSEKQADEIYRRAFEGCQSQGFGIEYFSGLPGWLHALAGSGSSTLQYFFRSEVFLVGSNCPGVSEWIL